MNKFTYDSAVKYVAQFEAFLSKLGISNITVVTCSPAYKIYTVIVRGPQADVELKVNNTKSFAEVIEFVR